MGLHAAQAVFLLLMVVVAGFAVLAQRLRVPYPIVLVLAGLGLSFVPHMPEIPLDPDIIFLIFLPPLLFSAAWQTSWREFRENLVTSAMLAIGLVAFTVWGVAEVAGHFITALDWKAGFLLGAVVSTTDAISAASIAKRVGLPKRVMDVLESESLLNDATGLLALEFGVMMMIHGQTPRVGMALGRLLWLIAGGVSVGLAVAALIAWCEHFIDDGPIEIVVSLITPYLAYLAGEEVRASGVLSVVAAGLFLSRRSGSIYSPKVRLQSSGVWHAMDFALNGIVFCLIGLQLPNVLSGIAGYRWTTLVEYGLIFSIVLILLRLVWVYPGAYASWWIRTHFLKQTHEKPQLKDIFVVGWTGMRGVLCLAAAISLPRTLADGRPFTQRNLIVFLAFTVILVTLVGQGLTLPWIIERLGLAGKDHATAREIREARKAALQAAMTWLRRQRSTDTPDTEHTYDDVMHRYGHRLDALRTEPGDNASGKYMRMVEIARGASREERRVLVAMRAEGLIGDEALRTIESELDLSEVQLDKAKPIA